MDLNRFSEIMVEEGYTQLEAEFLWQGKPVGYEPSEHAVRGSAKDILPSFLAKRRLPNSETRMRRLVDKGMERSAS